MVLWANREIKLGVLATSSSFKTRALHPVQRVQEYFTQASFAEQSERWKYTTFALNFNKVALRVGQRDVGGGSWCQRVIVSERRTIGEDTEGDADRKQNKTLCQSVWLSLMSYFCEQRRQKRTKQSKRCCFLRVDSQSFLQAPPYHPSVAPSTHFLIDDLSEMGRVPLGSAGKVMLSIINREIKKEIQ